MEAPKESPIPGPDAERLKIEGDWRDAVKSALDKPKPKEGWPEPEDSTDAVDDDKDPS